MSSIGIAELAIIGGMACIALFGVLAGVAIVVAMSRRKDAGPPDGSA